MHTQPARHKTNLDVWRVQCLQTVSPYSSFCSPYCGWKITKKNILIFNLFYFLWLFLHRQTVCAICVSVVSATRVSNKSIFLISTQFIWSLVVQFMVSGANWAKKKIWCDRTSHVSMWTNCLQPFWGNSFFVFGYDRSSSSVAIAAKRWKTTGCDFDHILCRFLGGWINFCFAHSTHLDSDTFRLSCSRINRLFSLGIFFGMKNALDRTSDVLHYIYRSLKSPLLKNCNCPRCDRKIGECI